MKTCNRCGLEKPLSDFSDRSHVNRDGRRAKHWWCRSCVTAYNKAYRSSLSPDDLREKELLRLYGITLWEYNDFLCEQNGRCAICKERPQPGRKLFVDHDHETGENRGLLCPTCNALLGMAHDQESVLLAAARYLEVRRPLRLVG